MFCRPSVLYFNPRAPCGARPADKTVLFSSFHISIHGLRVEPDEMRKEFVEHVDISIHGLRVEPDILHLVESPRLIFISIHGLRVEPDVIAFNAKDIV